MFAVWGDPPAPAPPPAPPKDHFAILSVKQEDTGTGIKFIVATNVPCHLFMLWTSQNPEKHLTPILRRGVFWKNAIRFCFVGWNENEQEEEGYTLYHTFTKEPWAVCETRWFTFRAKIEDKWAPSVGPIFKKHRVAGPQTMTFYPDPHPEVTSCDGATVADHGYNGVTWPEFWSGPAISAGASFVKAAAHIAAGDNADKWRRLERNFLLFDTSIILPEHTILSATFRVQGSAKASTADWPNFSVALVSSSPLSNTDIVIADHHSLGATLLSDTLIKYADWKVDD
ncbi:unnamed protein product, partial [marine sediment metagenome]